MERISTILEFVGILKNSMGEVMPPSSLMATNYLPSLDNIVWEWNDRVIDSEPDAQVEIDKPLQLAIKRARVGVEILKRPSDPHTKFELFQRLNSGGTQANPQELRNCLIVMVSQPLLNDLRYIAGQETFKALLHSSEEQTKSQRDMEMLTRFLVYRYVPYDRRLDIEEYIDKRIISIAERGLFSRQASKEVQETFKLLYSSLGENALKQVTDGTFRGRVGLTALEIVAVGIAQNLTKINQLDDPKGFVSRKVTALWSNEHVKQFSKAGLRGTQRIQQTIPFGAKWFEP